MALVFGICDPDSDRREHVRHSLPASLSGLPHLTRQSASLPPLDLYWEASASTPISIAKDRLSGTRAAGVGGGRFRRALHDRVRCGATTVAPYSRDFDGLRLHFGAERVLPRRIVRRHAAHCPGRGRAWACSRCTTGRRATSVCSGPRPNCSSTIRHSLPNPALMASPRCFSSATYPTASLCTKESVVRVRPTMLNGRRKALAKRRLIRFECPMRASTSHTRSAWNGFHRAWIHFTSRLPRCRRWICSCREGRTVVPWPGIRTDIYPKVGACSQSRNQQRSGVAVRQEGLAHLWLATSLSGCRVRKIFLVCDEPAENGIAAGAVRELW